MATEPNATILILASSGPLRSALQALVNSLHGVRTVWIAEDYSNVLEITATTPPRLVILTEMGLGRTRKILGALSERTPKIRAAIILEDSHSLSSDYPEADLVLPLGTHPEALSAALQLLIDEEI